MITNAHSTLSLPNDNQCSFNIVPTISSSIYDENRVINSEDEFNIDKFLIDEDGEDEIREHLIKSFGSTFQCEFHEEVQKNSYKEGLSQIVKKTV